MSEVDPEAVLRPLRDRIDAVDDRLVEALAERIVCVNEVVKLKQAKALPARLHARIEEVVARVRDKAERLGAPPDLAEILWRTMIEWVIAYEQRCLDSSAGAARE